MLFERVDLARKPSRLRTFLSDSTPGLSAESPVRVLLPRSREEHQMSSRSGSYESAGVAERRAQRALNEKVGDRLLARPRSQRMKWLAGPFGNRRKARAKA
jgi:hypothetical protein